MKSRILFRLVSGVGTLSLIAACAPEAPPVDVAAEQASIRDRLDQGFQAVQNQDWETLSGLISDDWVIFTHLGAKWNLDEMQEFFGAHIADHRITISDMSIRVSGDGRLAWARFDEETQYTFDGNPIQEKAVFTAVFEKTDAEWKMVHLHRSAQPPPSEEQL